MSDILDTILEAKRLEVTELRLRLGLCDLKEHIKAQTPPRGFANNLRKTLAQGRSAVIAEIKKASPSKGLLRADFRPDEIAKSYTVANASCLSVLTDRAFFQGDAAHLTLARGASSLPILRKDFVIDAYQIFEARALGADCVLLIVAALDPAQLRELCACAQDLGLDVLVEVHDEAELAQALALPDALLGVNNRNLRSFVTDISTSVRLAREAPADRLLISESGIHRREDIKTLREAGINAFLIGEAFMRAPDPGAALKALVEP